MLRKIREAQKNEEGFTLIELLVVVIIIGILAAIAIPAFLSQRERAYQAALTSDVRNAALEIEAQTTAGAGDIPAAPSGTFEVSEATTVLEYYTNAASGVEATAFCLVGDRDDLTGFVAYSSLNGGLQDFSSTAAAGTTADCGTPPTGTTWGNNDTLSVSG